MLQANESTSCPNTKFWSLFSGRPPHSRHWEGDLIKGEGNRSSVVRSRRKPLAINRVAAGRVWIDDASRQVEDAVVSTPPAARYAGFQPPRETLPVSEIASKARSCLMSNPNSISPLLQLSSAVF
jgi:hypothetical protein